MDDAGPKIPEVPDENAPLFMVSHRTAPPHPGEPESDQDANAPFLDFFKLLSRHVSQLVARPAGHDPGFIDLKNLDAGADWQSRVFKAVGTCQVLVVLLSAPSLGSDWCGREWTAFAQRPCWSRGDAPNAVSRPECILPVLWAPYDRKTNPAVVSQAQLFIPKRADKTQEQLYFADGVYGLYTIGDDAYKFAVWSLAKEISRILRDFWVEPRIAEDPESLPSAFRARGTGNTDSTGSKGE